MKIIQNLWFLCSIGLILSIMVHNPKSQGMIGQNQVFNGTRSAEETGFTNWGILYLSLSPFPTETAMNFNRFSS